MNKIEAYERLVEKRKACSLCNGLCNPAMVGGGQYDSGHIGPWSLWQGNLRAALLVVGQDWGDVSYFTRWTGRDQPSGNDTNENLQHLLETVGIRIGRPRDPQDQVVFLTNLILCLKTKGGLQGDVDDEWFSNCSKAFFKPLLEMISPRAIIALGKKVSESILALCGIPYSKHAALSKLMSRSPYQLTNSTVLFPVYHCGAKGVNFNRSMPEQKEDWSKVKEWLQNNESH